MHVPAYAPLPFALAHLGWGPGVSMLVLAGVVTWYTSLLLASLDRHDGVRRAGPAHHCRKRTGSRHSYTAASR